MTKILLWRVVMCDFIVASKWSIFWESERSITNTNTSGALPLPDMLSPAALRGGGYLGGPKLHQRQRMLFLSELSLSVLITTFFVAVYVGSERKDQILNATILMAHEQTNFGK